MMHHLRTEAVRPLVSTPSHRALRAPMSSRVAYGALRCVLFCAGFFSASADAAPGPWDLERVSLQSSVLTRFWRTPIALRAAVYVPTACQGSVPRCPVLYHFPGSGGSIESAWDTVGTFAVLSENNSALKMAHVYLDGTFNGSDHYFVDSANNGPWRSALLNELIPFVEKSYRIGGSAKLRYLHGYSTGGWTAVSLQTAYSKVFNGVWGIAPDPVDFRFFFRTDVTPGSRDNFYFDSAGAPKVLSRGSSTSLADYMQFVDYDPARPGLISVYEFVWSARGRDGYPAHLFNRSSGVLESRTLTQWARYDIARLLKAGGTGMKRALAGKLNLYCGTNDNYFLNEPTAALCEFLANAGYQATCRLVPGRNHYDLYSPSSFYPQGLPELILTQAAQRAGTSQQTRQTRTAPPAQAAESP